MLNYSISNTVQLLPSSTSGVGTFVLCTNVGGTSWLLCFCGSFSNQKRISNTLRKLIPVRRPNIPPEYRVVNHWWIIQIKCIVKIKFFEMYLKLSHIGLLTHVRKIIGCRISKLFVDLHDSFSCKLEFYHSYSNFDVSVTYIITPDSSIKSNLLVSSHERGR